MKKEHKELWVIGAALFAFGATYARHSGDQYDESRLKQEAIISAAQTAREAAKAANDERTANYKHQYDGAIQAVSQHGQAILQIFNEAGLGESQRDAVFEMAQSYRYETRGLSCGDLSENLQQACYEVLPHISAVRSALDRLDIEPSAVSPEA